MQLSNPTEPPNAWLLTPADTLLQFIADEQIVTAVTHRALVNINFVPLLLAAAREQIPSAAAESRSAFQKMIEISAGDLGFAAKEEATGFNTLFSHAAVGT